MNREEAIQTIEAFVNYVKMGNVNFSLEAKTGRIFLESLETVTAELRNLWVKTADRLPTESDADNTMCWVLATTISSNLPMPEPIAYIRANPDRYPYWMPIPPLPEVEE